MKSLIHIYKYNIYGIIGTLLFHVVLVGTFLLSEMNLKKNFREKELTIEIAVDLLTGAEPLPADPGPADHSPAGTVGNQPSRAGDLFGATRLAHRDPFFDNAYQEEINAARKLAEEVDAQLSKKKPDPDELSMPEDNSAGKSRAEISNKVYSGESNIEYRVGDRYHLRLPIPVYLARGGGVVVVDISVNREGKVIAATPRQNGPAEDSQVYYYARIAAESSLFNPDPAAPASQIGYIRYTFVAQ